MANSLYDAGREGFLDGNCDWDTHSFKVVCIDHATDTPVVATDDNLDDLLVGSRIATSSALTSVTKTAGVADAADVTLSLVSGASFESINIFKDTGTESTSRLVAYIDTATGLPCTPNGADITIAWDNGANKIFKL